MQEKDIYEKLAAHLSKLPMGLPASEELIEILKESFTPREAEVATALPNNVVPLGFVEISKIPKVAGLSKEEMVEVLENLSQRGLVFTGKTQSGEKGYALWQYGFGFPQVFHWKGEDTPQARKMAEHLHKYTSNPKVHKERSHFKGPKPYRYIPIKQSIEVAKQGVYSQHMMEEVVGNAKSFAVAHCPCRVRHNIVSEGCDHPTDVCLKFNDTAEFLTEKGFARKITREEALEIIEKSEEAGLVHFVDNAGGDIQHN